jgi:hypothetical protein
LEKECAKCIKENTYRREKIRGEEIAQLLGNAVIVMRVEKSPFAIVGITDH